MKNIEDSLRDIPVSPKRELRANFTKATISKLNGRPSKMNWLAHIKEIIIMRIPHTPLGIGLTIIGALAVSGTATAATIGWQNFSVLFGGQKTVSSQSRVIQVNTQNCRLTNNAFDVLTKDKKQDNAYYYRIKASANYTDAQITQMVQGECDLENESLQNTTAVQTITGKSVNEPSDLVGGYIDNTITAINSQTISFTFTMVDADRGNKTFTMKDVPINSNILVLDKGKTIKVSDLKVGDHFGYVYHATGDALTHSETTPPWAVAPSSMSMAIIMKNPDDVADALKLENEARNKVERVAPCTTQPDGYCNIEQQENK